MQPKTPLNTPPSSPDWDDEEDEEDDEVHEAKREEPPQAPEKKRKIEADKFVTGAIQFLQKASMPMVRKTSMIPVSLSDSEGEENEPVETEITTEPPKVPRQAGRRSASMRSLSVKSVRTPTVHLRPAEAASSSMSIPQLLRNLPPLDASVTATLNALSTNEILQAMLEIQKRKTYKTHEEASKIGYAIGNCNKEELVEAMNIIARTRNPTFCAEMADALIRGACQSAEGREKILASFRSHIPWGPGTGKIDKKVIELTARKDTGPKPTQPAYPPPAHAASALGAKAKFSPPMVKFPIGAPKHIRDELTRQAALKASLSSSTTPPHVQAMIDAHDHTRRAAETCFQEAQAERGKAKKHKKEEKKEKKEKKTR